jgi:hypothetical protein
MSDQKQDSGSSAPSGTGAPGVLRVRGEETRLCDICLYPIDACICFDGLDTFDIDEEFPQLTYYALHCVDCNVAANCVSNTQAELLNPPAEEKYCTWPVNVLIRSLHVFLKTHAGHWLETPEATPEFWNSIPKRAPIEPAQQVAPKKAPTE